MNFKKQEKKTEKQLEKLQQRDIHKTKSIKCTVKGIIIGLGIIYVSGEKCMKKMKNR